MVDTRTLVRRPLLRGEYNCAGRRPNQRICIFAQGFESPGKNCDGG